MCDPVTIAGIALTAGSTVMNSMAASKVQKARDQALAAERIRQQRLDQEAAALNTQSQDRYVDFEGQQDQKATELGDYFKDQQIAAGSANEQATKEMNDAALPQSGSNLTVREEGQQRSNARDFTNAQGEALGNLRAFGDLIGDIGRLQARDASQIGQIGGFKRGSSAVLPYELEAANQAGNGMKMFGDALNFAGGASSSGLASLFGTKAPLTSASSMTSTAKARAADRASVPGYAYKLF